MTSVIANDCSIPATFVAGIKQSLVITFVIRTKVAGIEQSSVIALVIRSQRVKVYKISRAESLASVKTCEIFTFTFANEAKKFISRTSTFANQEQTGSLNAAIF